MSSSTRPFSDNDLRGLSDSIPVVRRISKAQRRKAALYVVDAATDVEDAQLLLQILGLEDVA